MKNLISTFALMIAFMFMGFHQLSAIPYIAYTDPLPNSHTLDANGNITVKFTYFMNSTSINDETVLVNGSQSGRMHSVISYDDPGRTARIHPVHGMKPGEVVSVYLTSGIKTVWDEHISPYAFKFKAKPVGGTGVFSSTLTSNISTNASILGTGDFDGDGDIDLLARSDEGGVASIFIYKNDGTGRFNDSSSKSPIAPENVRFIIADFDNDGDLDAAGIEEYLSLYNQDYNVRIYKNNGSGVFTYYSIIDFFDGRSIAYGDIDGDGDIDFAIANAHQICIFDNDGTGAFTAGNVFGTGCTYYFCSGSALAIEDFRHFGVNDIFFLGHYREEEPGFNCIDSRMYLNSGGGNFTMYHAAKFEPSSFITEDLNNDRMPDLVMAPYRILFYRDEFGWWTGAPFPGGSMTADVNGDANIDLVEPGGPGVQPSVFLNDGNGNFTALSSSGSQTLGSGYPCGDFDNDGDIDVLKSGTSAGELVLYKNVSSCLINGPSILADSVTVVYRCAGLTGFWTLVNNPPCNAFITGPDSNDSVMVCSGTASGSFTLGFHSPDSVLQCSKVVNVDIALPAELATFTAEVSGRDVMIHWTTTFESDNAGFDIERKAENASWTKTGFVKGSGTVNTVSEYSYADKNLQTGKYSYRLKQIDYNGNYKYFELAQFVLVGKPDAFSLSQNYPNPFNPSTKINYAIPEDGFVSIIIYDTDGRQIAVIEKSQKASGYYSAELNGAALSSGIYFCRLSLNANASGRTYSAVRKLVLVK